MVEKCPECNSDLIKLYTATWTTGHWGTGYWDADFYAYWCPFDEKMYVKKHKEWIERWKYDSSVETIKGDKDD